MIEMKLKEFMDTYEGFNWKNGKLIIVKNNKTPFIITGAYHVILEHHLEDRVAAMTHDENTMVITLK